MTWPYPNFTRAEFACKHTGKCLMQPGFMDRLQRLRTAYGKPMIITSGYRDRTHPVERAKAVPGVHTLGCAADVGVRGADALALIWLAIAMGFTGIGVQQKGAARFVHLDDAPNGQFPRPTIWSY